MKVRMSLTNQTLLFFGGCLGCLGAISFLGGVLGAPWSVLAVLGVASVLSGIRTIRLAGRLDAKRARAARERCLSCGRPYETQANTELH